MKKSLRGGSAAATGESRHLDPELGGWANDEGRTDSDVTREALRDWLKAS